MEKLKIGNKLYIKNSSRYSDFTDYKFADVVRLTKTQAVLSNGTKLINEPTTNWNDSNKIHFSEYGDRFNKWTFQTPEIIQEALKERKRINIYNWFKNKVFTESEKEQVYNLLTPHPTESGN